MYSLDRRDPEATWHREPVHVHLLLVGLRRLVHQQLYAEAVDGVRNGEPLVTAAAGKDSEEDIDADPTVFLESDLLMMKQWGVFVLKMKRLEVCAIARNFIQILWMTCLLRRRAKVHSRSIDELVQNFSVRSAACVCEADRAPVERNIVEMLKSQGQLARDGGHEEGMDMFDQLVRERLPPALHVRYCYRDALAIGIVLLGEAFDFCGVRPPRT